ncbi:hypothetical protein Tco_0386702 [Tanacetum coccineum]
MTPLVAQLERKPRRDRGTRIGRHSTSSSFAFDQPSSSHLNDDDDDGNDEGTSRASTPSHIRYVNSLTNQVPQVFQNPPNIDPHLEPFYTRQTEIINRQVQLRDEQRGEGAVDIVKSRVEYSGSGVLGEWSRNEEITVLTTNMPYPSRKIQRICACTHQRPQRKQDPIRRIQKKAMRCIKAIWK